MKRRYLKMPAELGDGVNSFVHGEQSAALLGEMLQTWFEHGDVGDAVTIELIELTDDEFDSLPEQ